MTDNLIHRSYTAEFDVRRSRRLIEGRAVPYGVPAEVSDDGGETSYTEQWDLGAFADQLRDRSRVGRVRLTYEHDPSLRSWFGKAVDLEEREDGLYGQWKVDDTDDGDVALYKAGSGQLSGLSIGARADESVTRGRVKHRVRSWLYHVSLVEEPAFADAQVQAVRSAVDLSPLLPWQEKLQQLREKRDAIIREP